jgi:hypothetical protein
MATYPEQAGVSYPVITGQDGNRWGTAFHLGRAGDPVWRLRNPGRETQILRTRGWHMSDEVANRIPTGDQDRGLLVVDQAFGYSVFFGVVVPHRGSRTITASASAIYWHRSNGLDGRNPRSNDNRNFCSRGRIPDSIVIRPELVRAGIQRGTGLGHVLQIALSETNARTFGRGYVHPMIGCEDRHVTGWGAEGERIRIAPGVNLVSRGLSGGALVIARTLQQHGAYIGDNSGSAATLKGAQSARGYVPYAGTNVTADCLKGKISWKDFEVVKAGWQ